MCAYLDMPIHDKVRTNENTVYLNATTHMFDSASTSNGSQGMPHLENTTLRRTFLNKLPVESSPSLHEVCVGIIRTCDSDNNGCRCRVICVGQSSLITVQRMVIVRHFCYTGNELKWKHTPVHMLLFCDSADI